MKPSILIIEDHLDVRENLGEILTLSGYTTTLASNGKEGVKAALLHPPDLILCDIMMPELDGYGVLRILTRNETTAGIPFIFLSARTELSDVRRGMTLGADDYITKPFDDVELLDTIAMRLQKRNQGLTIPSSSSLHHPPSPEQILETLRESVQDPEPRMVRRKDLLYAEGQTCRSVFLLLSGRAIATKIDDYSKEVITQLYQFPSVIGVSSVFAGHQYRETVRAFEDLEVLAVRKDAFMQSVLQHPAISLHFLQQLAQWQLKADEKLLLQAFGSVRMKLASTLLDLFEAYVEDDQATIPVSREDLAAMAGTAKETIIRCLSEFKEEGLVVIQGSDIIIHNVKKLEALRY